VSRLIIIDGDSFSDMETFYCEIDSVLTKDLDWKTGHNLNAFNDLLRGGFGIHDYEEAIRLIWINFAKSKRDLGSKLDIIVEIIKHHDHIDFATVD
jgi:RNAse (barnase) inhibitor barstar